MPGNKARAEPLSPAAQRKLADDLTRLDFGAFFRRTFETVAPGEALSFNWHIDAIAYQLERIRRGKAKRLIILLPPRYLKSLLISVALPAFLLGHDPTVKIIAVSYSDELATKHHNDCRAVMRSLWYRRIFPGTQISSEKNTDSEFVTTKRGGRLATSVGGTLTGRGANLIIVDDPMKAEDANSESARRRAIDWFHSTLISRLNNKAQTTLS